MKRKRISLSRGRYVPPVLQRVYREDNRYPADTVKQVIRLMTESCLGRAWDTALEYRVAWGLCSRSGERVSLREIGCVPWMGRWNGGVPAVWGFGSKSLKSAIRVMYEWFVGPIPRGHWVHMACGERGCTNPTHMYISKCKRALPARIDSTMTRMVEALKTMVLRGWKRFSSTSLLLLGKGDGRERIVKMSMPAEKIARIERLLRQEREAEKGEEEEEESEPATPRAFGGKGFDRGDASEDEEWGMEEWMERLEVFQGKNGVPFPQKERVGYIINF